MSKKLIYLISIVLVPALASTNVVLGDSPPKTAYDPVPADGATSVDTHVTLSWTPGLGALIHTVYFGDNFDDVYNAAGSFPQETPAFTPGPLEPGKTYYWRVDEFDAVDLHKGDVWSFTTLSEILIIDDQSLVIYYSFDDVSGIIADQSGKGHDGTVQGDVTADTDGKQGGAAKFASGSYLDLDGPNFPPEDIPTSAITLAAWVKCENTGGHHAIFNAKASDGTWLIHPELRSNGQFRWLLRAYGGFTIFDIRAGSVTWDEWLHYASTYDKASGKAILYINGEVVREEKVTNPRYIAGDWGRGARVGYNIDNARPFTGLMDDFCLFKRALPQAEIKKIMQGIIGYPFAFGPDPADGAMHGDTWVNLGWTPGTFAVSHDVYFGENFDDVDTGAGDTFQGNQTATSFNVGLPGGPYPDGLVPDTTYYWRVDEVNAPPDSTIHKGDVWSFTVAEPLSEALDTALSFTTGGSADWFSQTTMSRYGQDAAQSGDISNRQDSWMQTTLSGKGTVKFYWKVSSEEDFDFLEFYIDGSLQEQISGLEVDWQQNTYTISTSGSHTLEWRYMKDGSGDYGSDCGWVDKVQW